MRSKKVLIILLILLSAFFTTGCVDEQTDQGEIAETHVQGEKELQDPTLMEENLSVSQLQTSNFDAAATPVRVSLEEAQDKVSFEVSYPSYIPEDYNFIHASIYKSVDKTASEGVLESVGLLYKNNTGFISISEKSYHNDSFKYQATDDDETVNINGHEATYIEFSQGHALIWDVDDIQICIYAMTSKEEILRMAKSIK
ncbi:DUF4367 domain-containing protein [Methanolobus sp. ZRKC2]|uniref:DUF4367 domain-containing protein n=1 Tax=Methanolobus sp. ZRKC2 TaxID=3125783 RepID=UPI0032512127